MEEENVEAVVPLHAAPFWWWGAAWRGVGHVSPCLELVPWWRGLRGYPWWDDDAPRGFVVTPRRRCLVPPRETPLREGLVLVEYLVMSMKILSCRCRWAAIGPSSRWTEAPLFLVHRQLPPGARPARRRSRAGDSNSWRARCGTWQRASARARLDGFSRTDGRILAVNAKRPRSWRRWMKWALMALGSGGSLLAP